MCQTEALVTSIGKIQPYTKKVPRVLDPFRFVLIAMAGCMNQQQQQMIEYLREENRVLREQLGGRRLRFTDEQRRRLAAKAKGMGRKLLAEVATLVTPETLLAWHRKLIALKYDGSQKRDPGRPCTAGEIEALARLWPSSGTAQNVKQRLAQSLGKFCDIAFLARGAKTPMGPVVLAHRRERIGKGRPHLAVPSLRWKRQSASADQSVG
jgi:hypothetical protein